MDLILPSGRLVRELNMGRGPTAPHEDGRGAEAAMRAATNGDLVDYVNAHGTGTLLNDSAETKAIAAAFMVIGRGVCGT